MIMDYVMNSMNLTEKIQTYATILLLCEVVFGALNCFFGYKLLKVWIAVCGFMIGAVSGFLIAARFLSERNIVFGITAAAGIVGCVLAYQIYLVGVFFLGWMMSVVAVTAFVRSLPIGDKEKLTVIAAGVLIGLIVGVLIVKFARPSIILLTGISGGISTATAAFSLLKLEQPTIVMTGAGVLLAVVGILVQFLTTPGHNFK